MCCFGIAAGGYCLCISLGLCVRYVVAGPRGGVKRALAPFGRCSLATFVGLGWGARHAFFFFFQAEDGIRDFHVTGVQTCALPISALALALAISEPRFTAMATSP